MATYKQVQELVRERHRFVPKTCWIAHILSENGRVMRQAPNRIAPDARKHPCPPDKRKPILDVLRHFGMVGPHSN